MRAHKKSRSNPPSVWLVEENPLAVRYLQDARRRIHFAWIGSYDETLRRGTALKGSPRVLVVDRGPAPNSEAGFLQPLESRFRDARILVVGKEAADEDLCHLVLQGAWGFINYEDIPHDLRHAVQAVSEGHLWIERNVLDKLPLYARSMPKSHQPGMAALTQREKMVLSLLQRRLCNKEIASTLGISERTVKFHLENVYTKLGVHDRHSAADLARASYRPQVDPAQEAKG